MAFFICLRARHCDRAVGLAGQRTEEIRYRRERYRNQDRPDRSFSGPASAYAGIGKTHRLYADDQRTGRYQRPQINLIQYDDAYSPPKAVEQVRKLVESDEVLLTFQIIGTRRTPPSRNISTRRRCRSYWQRPAPRNSPIPRTSWTMGFNPNYQSEGRICKIHSEEPPQRQDRHPLPERRPRRDYITGLKEALGAKRRR